VAKAECSAVGTQGTEGKVELEERGVQVMPGFIPECGFIPRAVGSHSRD
jgi:hypothetical protein